MTTTKQLSRVAGVPRLKLPIWKAAAAQFFQGKEATREEQRNSGKQSKVGLLRELAASDPAVRSWVIKFASDLRSREARAQAAAQGWTITDPKAKPALTARQDPMVSVMVQALESGEITEISQANRAFFERHGINPDQFPSEPDPDLEVLIAAPDKPKPAPTYVCEGCGGPWTRVLYDWHHYCDRCNGTPTLRSPRPSILDQGPADYINSDFGRMSNEEFERVKAFHGEAHAIERRNKIEHDRALARAIADSRGSNLSTGKPMVGPAPKYFVTAGGGFENPDGEESKS